MINPKAARVILTVLTQMLSVEIKLTKLALWAEDLLPQMDRLYGLLPPNVKEAIGRLEETAPPAAETGPGLVADEKFFDEIERFLDQHWRQEGGEEEENGGLLS
jgi:hypothetical protein